MKIIVVEVTLNQRFTKQMMKGGVTSMNSVVFNEANNPLYVSTNDKNPVITNNIETAYTADGILYIASTTSQLVLTGDFLLFQITNPAGSGKNINIARLTGGATTSTTMDIIRDGTFAAAGTAMTPRNRNTLFPDASVMTTKYITAAVDPTVGGVLWSSTIQSGGPLGIEYFGRYIVSPGHTFYIRLTNTSLITNSLSANVTWWEL